MRLVAVGIAAALGACTSYAPGSFADTAGAFAGERQVIGCVDLAVSARLGDEVMVDYAFGNHCRNRVMFDLAHVRVVARDGAGVERELAPDDPTGEIEPLQLGGFASGREAIAYTGVPGDAAVSVCVDVGGVDGDAPRTSRVICAALRTEAVR